MVLKDEGLIFSFLKCLPLEEAKKVWSVNRLFYKVLDGKVIPLLALYEHDWSTVSYYMDLSLDAWPEGHAPCFEYNLDNIATEAIQHQEFQGLQLLACRK